jgi:hypothetical protein
MNEFCLFPKGAAKVQVQKYFYILGYLNAQIPHARRHTQQTAVIIIGKNSLSLPHPTSLIVKMFNNTSYWKFIGQFINYNIASMLKDKFL